MSIDTMTNSSGSAVVTALERVWGEIRTRHPELPEVVMITGSGNMGLGLKWGHFCHDAWSNGRFRVWPDGTIERDRKPELFISGERLAVGPVETVQTMLHEAAHALGAIRGIKTTSRQNRYHNRRFVELANELGLAYEGAPHPTIGFSDVQITDETKAAYADVIAALGEAITVSIDLPGWAALLGKGAPGSGGDGVKGAGKTTAKSRNNSKAVCGCETPRIIRVAPSVLAAAPITCGACEQDFAPEE